MPYNYPVTGTTFEIDVNPFPGRNTGTQVLNVSSRGRQTLTPAGLHAVILQVDTYLSAAKILSLQLNNIDRRLLPTISFEAGAFSYPVLPTDIAAQVSSLTTVLQTAANVAN